MNVRTFCTFLAASAALLPLVDLRSSYALPPVISDLRVVALSGKTAPGTGGQIFAPQLGIGGVINSQGQVLFGGDTQTATGVRPGMWFESSPGQASLILLNNNPAPGVGSGKTYDYQGGGDARINQSGNIAYAYGYKPYPVDNSGFHAYGVGEAIWSTAGGLHVVAADGLPYPVGSSGPIANYVGSNLWLNDAGQIAFNSYDGTNSHIWVDTPGQPPREVVSTLSAVPGVPGAKFDYFGAPLLNSSGRVTFGAALVSGQGGVTDNTLSGLWQENTAGVMQLVARGNQVAPETGGQLYDRYPVLAGPVGFNSAGQMAFLSSLAGAPGSRIIYVEDASLQLHKIARDGDPAFGVPGATFLNLGAPVINDLGQVAFVGADNGITLQQYDATGIWSNVGGSFHPVMRVGQTLPDTPAGSVASYINGMILNNRGQVLFGADYGNSLGNGTFSYLGTGIWAQDSNGVIRTILRNGDVVDVDPGVGLDLRTVSFIELGFYDANGRGMGKFNERGEILLSLDFTDGTHGLFVSNLLAVPEPATTTYLAILAIALGASRGGCARAQTARDIKSFAVISAIQE